MTMVSTTYFALALQKHMGDVDGSEVPPRPQCQLRLEIVHHKVMAEEMSLR